MQRSVFAIYSNPGFQKFAFFVLSLMVLILILKGLGGTPSTHAEGASALQQISLLRSEQVELEKQLSEQKIKWEVAQSEKEKAEVIFREKESALAQVELDGKTIRESITQKDADITRLRDGEGKK